MESKARILPWIECAAAAAASPMPGTGQGRRALLSPRGGAHVAVCARAARPVDR